MNKTNLNSFRKRNTFHKLYHEQVFIHNYSFETINTNILTLFTCGESLYSPGYNPVFVNHCYDIEVVLDGRMTYSCGDDSWFVSPGDVILVAPGKRCSFQVPAHSSLKKIFIMINNSRLASLLFNSSSIGQCCCLQSCKSEKIIQNIREINQLCQKNDEDQMLKISILLYAIIAELIAKHETVGNDISTRFSRKLFLLLNGAIGNNYSLDYIAAHFGVGKRTLNRMFKKNFNCSPMHYLALKKMEYAAALLEQSDSSIQSIAGECGFSEPALFSRVFTRFYGISPRNYRRKLVPKRRAKD